jgi:hypothetical protein
MIIMQIIVTPGNAYGTVGSQLNSGLGSIQSGLTSGMTFANLTALVSTYIQTTYPTLGSDQFATSEFNGVVTNAANFYINSNLDGYNAAQMPYIQTLLNGLYGVPIGSIPDFIADLEDNINKSSLSLEDQVPLFIATSVATNSYNYWLAAVASPGNWASKGYFNSNAYVNYANIPYWVEAAVQATLTGGNKAATYGQIDPPRIIGVDLVSALASGLTVSAGKVLFRWIPKVQPIMAGGGCSCGS